MDIVAFKGKGIVSKMISLCTWSPYTHVGMALWFCGRLMIVESREFRGARIVWLSNEIKNKSVDIFRVWDERDMEIAKIWALEHAGNGYSYLGIVRYFRRIIRKLLGLPLPSVMGDDRVDHGNRFCSEYVSAAYRAAGIDLRPDLVDSLTPPGELVLSRRLRRVLSIDG